MFLLVSYIIHNNISWMLEWKPFFLWDAGFHNFFPLWSNNVLFVLFIVVFVYVCLFCFCFYTYIYICFYNFSAFWFTYKNFFLYICVCVRFCVCERESVCVYACKMDCWFSLYAYFQMPGVNLPVSQIWYYMLTLLICGILHEVGHAIAAVR